MNEQQLQGFTIKFQIYAHNAQEAAEAQQAIILFISQQAQQGRAVTAEKVAKAVANWDKNPVVKSSIINYFK